MGWGVSSCTIKASFSEPAWCCGGDKTAHLCHALSNVANDALVGLWQELEGAHHAAKLAQQARLVALAHPAHGPLGVL